MYRYIIIMYNANYLLRSHRCCGGCLHWQFRTPSLPFASLRSQPCAQSPPLSPSSHRYVYVWCAFVDVGVDVCMCLCLCMYV